MFGINLFQSTKYGEFKRPTKRFRITLGCSLAFTLLCMLTLTATICTNLRKHYATEELTKQVKEANTEFVKSRLPIYFFNSSILEYLNLNVENTIKNNKKVLLAASEELLGLIELIANRKYSGLENKYKSFKKKYQKNLIIKSQSGMSGRWFIQQIDKTSLNFFNNYKQNKELQESYPKKLKLLTDAINSYETSQSPARVDMARLFSLERLLDKPAEGLYKSGVLAGTPILAGLPDGIKSFNDLKSKLNMLNGEVAIRGENAPKMFALELERIKKRATNEETSLESLRKEKEDLNKNIKNVIEERDKAANDFKNLLVRLAVDSFIS